MLMCAHLAQVQIDHTEGCKASDAFNGWKSNMRPMAE